MGARFEALDVVVIAHSDFLSIFHHTNILSELCGPNLFHKRHFSQILEVGVNLAVISAIKVEVIFNPYSKSISLGALLVASQQRQ